MSAYVQALKLQAEHERAEQRLLPDQEARAAEQAVREKLVPLAARLARLLATIPPAVPAEGLSLLTLQVQLRARGRGPARCHVGELERPESCGLRETPPVARRRRIPSPMVPYPGRCQMSVGRAGGGGSSAIAALGPNAECLSPFASIEKV